MKKLPFILSLFLMLSVFGGCKTASDVYAASFQTNKGFDKVRVALLLPLSGPNSVLGQAMLKAAKLAVLNFADKRFKLLVHDTRGTPEGASKAGSAAIGDGASMIVGPLLASSVRAVGPLARAANIPVVAFSSDRSVAGNGTYTMGFLPSAQIWRIVDYAQSKGLQRFAVLAPNNVYGKTVISAFRAAVASYGRTLVRVQYFDPRATDLSPAVRALGDFDNRRQALLARRKELEGRADEASQLALKQLEQSQSIGDPSFDTLLLADGGKRLKSIAALLPLYDIDPGKIRILGTGQWDVPGLGSEPALVGGLYAAPSPMARAEFIDAYKDVYGVVPPRLATLAYDATAMVAVLARANNGPDFSARAITAASGFWGRDGIFRFLPSGIAERGLAVMRVGRYQPEVLSSAPQTFQEVANKQGVPNKIAFGKLTTDDPSIMQHAPKAPLIGQSSPINPAVETSTTSLPPLKSSETIRFPFKSSPSKAKDTTPPTIKIASAITVNTDSPSIRGHVSDDDRVVQVTIEGRVADLKPDGTFTFSRYIPAGSEETVRVEAIDEWGNKSTKNVKITRAIAKTTDQLTLAKLNPTKIKGRSNKDAIALIIGVANYSRAPAATFADNDANVFGDYAHRALGVPRSNIKVMINNDTSRTELKIAIKRWLRGRIEEGKTDVHVFFAGHGLASPDGKDLYLLPYDGETSLLDETALLRRDLFDVISKAKPKSATIFLDTCYSGLSRGKETLLASARGIVVTAKPQSIPKNFTVLSAASGQQISSGLDAAKHGLFSYYLMKGMEGGADANKDRKITAGELHAYLSKKVQRQAVRLGREQTPELSGDGERVLVRW